MGFRTLWVKKLAMFVRMAVKRQKCRNDRNAAKNVLKDWLLLTANAI